MKKVVQNRYGGPEVLEVVDVPEPSDLGGDGVLVHVTFAGLNPVDGKFRSGAEGRGAVGDFPVTLGWDVAGVVAAVGPEVGQLRTGDRVFGMTGFPAQASAYAQAVVMHEADLARTPAEVTDEQAAALPLAGLTAWQDLVEVAKLERGQRVLIQGAGGGVGHLAVQIAHDLGATVIASASAGKADRLRSLGADLVIDYTSDDVAAVLDDDPVDVVLDAVSGPVSAQSVAVTRRGGVVVDLPGHMPDETKQAASEAGVRVEQPAVHNDATALGRLAGLAGSGRLTPEISAVYDLDQVAQAHRALESGHTTGKILLRTR